MDTRFEIPPRLRLNRQVHSFAATLDDSNIHATVNYDRDTADEDDDGGSTPRLGMSKMSIDSFDGPLHFSGQAQAQSTPASGREAITPAERLRAVLSKAGSATPTQRTHFVAPENTPSSSASLLESDMESDDFETPRGGANGVPGTPYPQNGATSSPPESVSRANLKSLFSRALRSPGGTPERPQRTRRGSMDSSVAEESPIRWSMMKAGEKAKRLSLSDDEREKIRASRFGFVDGMSEKSFRSSQAATFDHLRERLANSSIGADTSKRASVAKSDTTTDMEEATEVEQELVSDHEAPTRSTTPPVPSSKSLGQSASQFPSQYLGSNLLTENSDVRRMIQEAQTETTDSEAPDKTPIAGPSSNRLKTQPSFVRERTVSGSSSVGSLSPTTNSRPTSRQSMNGYEDQDRKRERERGWNHPLRVYMERHRPDSPGFSPTHSGGFARMRKASLSSISGSESNDGRSSPMSSIKRQSHHQVNSLGHSHPSPRSAGFASTRSPSSAPNQIRVSARTRTVSQPSNPNSPRSLGNSTNSNGTQIPLDRSRTVSLAARDISRPSSVLAHTHSRRERDAAPPHADSSTYLLESNGVEESEEHDTPKIAPQHDAEPPAPVSGSRPNSRPGTSSAFSSHNANKTNGHAPATASASTSMSEKMRRRRNIKPIQNTEPPRISVSSEPIDFLESDSESFQEKDIAALSSAPRERNGSDSFGKMDADSQDEESHPDIGVLRQREGARLDRRTGDSAVERTSFLPANFSPPPSPPIMPSDPVTTTPQRHIAANTSKLEFKTPSPPKGMPVLPDPPSSDEGLESDRTPPVPITPASKNRYTGVKTPRLPGAWSTPFATPAPAVTTRVSTVSKETDPAEKYAPLQDEAYTPPASYSRATSTIMKTPAPPGAWLATPATIAAKRLQQKVRFDEQEAWAAPVPVLARDDSSLNSDISVEDGSVAMKAAGRVKPPSPRTPGRIRVVDAFGNEITPAKNDDKTEKRILQKVNELHATAKDEKSIISDSRKSRIRVLDAMGREIDEVQVQTTTLASTAEETATNSKRPVNENITALFQGVEGKNLERKQALELLQETIAGLKDDFNRTDDPASAQSSDVIDSQISDLRAQSIRAKEDRERLLQKIRDMKTGDLPSRSTVAWNALLYGRGRSGLSNRRTYFKTFVALVFLQMLVFLAFYRLTALGARQLFLTTYIDPFYPELHLHITNPDLLQLSVTSPARSDVYTLASSSCWTYFFRASWHTILNRISTLRESVWDVWKDPPQGMTWPPT